MYYLYLTSFPVEKKVQVVKAVRAMYREVGSTAQATLRNSLDVVNQAASDPPALLWQHEDFHPVENAAHILRTSSDGHAQCVIEAHELKPEPEEETAGDSDNVEVSYQGCKTALTLLAICGGAPGSALMAAEILRKNTDDPIYDEVDAIIHDTFPDR